MPRLATSVPAALLAAAALLPGCDGGTRPTPARAALAQYDSCSALETDLRAMLHAEVDTYYDQALAGGGWFWGVDDAAEDGDAPPSGGGREEGVDFSGTNNQEQGVDEADFLKTDGYHLFLINSNRLHTFAVPEFGELAPEGELEFEGQPAEMLYDKDSRRGVVFSSIYPDALPAEHPLRERLGHRDADGNWIWRVWTVSKLTVVDLSDPAEPRLEREIYLEGWYQTARMVAGSVRMGTWAWMNIPGIYELWWDGEGEFEDWVAEARAYSHARVDETVGTDLVPRFYERSPDGAVSTHELTDGACRSFYRPGDSHGRGIASLVSIDLGSDDLAYDADHVVSNYPTLYASEDRLYLAEPANDWWWYWTAEDDVETLNIHAFDTSNPGQTVYLGSGRVDGVLHNQFSMGEHDGLLRVATTQNFWNRWWLFEEGDAEPPQPDNHVFVLALDDEAHELVEVGHLGGIANGERIMSARFVGDRGYVVTFLQIDPLFTIDLSDPTAPRLLGEVEVPGFSSYIHPISGDKLLTIGYDGDWATQVSMFDVADPTTPSLFDAEAFTADGQWSWSEASWQHKAFQYWAPKQLLAIPLATYRETFREEDGWYEYAYLSQLQLVRVDTETGLSKAGTIDHSHFYNDDPDYWWWNLDVRRTVFMGDFIYAFSDRGITVHRADDLSPVTEQELPGTRPEDVYWWW